jgi:cold shock CspA family protein
MTGFISGLNLDRGYGWIRSDEGQSYFWHMSALQDVVFSEQLKNMRVEFDPAPATDGRTPPAENVRPVQ